MTHAEVCRRYRQRHPDRIKALSKRRYSTEQYRMRNRERMRRLRKTPYYVKEVATLLRKRRLVAIQQMREALGDS